MWTLLLSLPLIAGPTPQPTPAQFHFTIVTKTTSEIDLSAMGQPSQSIVLTASAWVSATLTDTAGGKLANFVVDSSSFDAGQFTASMPPEMTASSKGTVFHVYLVGGKPFAKITPAPISVQGSQLIPGIELMLVGVHPTQVAAGWVDTTTSDTTMAEGGSAGTRITTWTAAAGAGGRVETNGTWTGTMTTTVGGGGMEMQMTGTSHVTAMPGALSESGTSTGKGTASLNIAGSAIPMKVTTEVTATATP